MGAVKMMSEQSSSSVGVEPTPAPPQEPAVKSRKKLFAVLSIVVIVAIVSTLALVLFVPRGLGEAIPYSFNYAVGEKMTYNMSMSVAAGSMSVSETGTVNLEILSFDGGNYTVNETAVFAMQGITQQFSFTLKMDRSGRISGFSSLPSEMQQLYSNLGIMPGFGFPANKTEARVGETWQLPLNTIFPNLTMSGNMNFKFVEIQNVTVPAGTYKTVKIEVTTDNVHVSSGNVYVSLDANGQMLMEYGTCRLIDMDLDETVTTSQGGQTMTMSLEMRMQLILHIRP